MNLNVECRKIFLEEEMQTKVTGYQLQDTRLILITPVNTYMEQEMFF